MGKLSDAIIALDVEGVKSAIVYKNDAELVEEVNEVWECASLAINEAKENEKFESFWQIVNILESRNVALECIPQSRFLQYALVDPRTSSDPNAPNAPRYDSPAQIKFKEDLFAYLSKKGFNIYQEFQSCVAYMKEYQELYTQYKGDPRSLYSRSNLEFAERVVKEMAPYAERSLARCYPSRVASLTWQCAQKVVPDTDTKISSLNEIVRQAHSFKKPKP